MKKALFVAIILCGCGSNHAPKNIQISNYSVEKCNVITTAGDTIEFYGGQLNYITTQRSWRLSNINMKNHE